MNWSQLPDPTLSLRERAELARLDRIQSNRDFLESLAVEIVHEILETPKAVLEDVEYDDAQRTITFTLDGIRLRVKAEVKTRTQTDGTVLTWELFTLSYIRKGGIGATVVPINELADLGKELQGVERPQCGTESD